MLWGLFLNFVPMTRGLVSRRSSRYQLSHLALCAAWTSNVVGMKSSIFPVYWCSGVHQQWVQAKNFAIFWKEDPLMIFWIKMKFHQRNRREQQKVRDIPVAFSIEIFNFANVCCTLTKAWYVIVSWLIEPCISEQENELKADGNNSG